MFGVNRPILGATLLRNKIGSHYFIKKFFALGPNSNFDKTFLLLLLKF